MFEIGATRAVKPTRKSRHLWHTFENTYPRSSGCGWTHAASTKTAPQSCRRRSTR
ncbi:hypothetical protein LTR56_027461, partial [Elasticomyces elasticus]